MAAENDWLSASGSFGREIRVAQRIKKILAHRDLADFLSVLETHNDKNRSRPFLLAPYLCHVIRADVARKDHLQGMPTLARPAWDLRAYYRNASKIAKRLARLLRKVPQPSVALSASDEFREALSLFQPFDVIQSRNQCDAIVPLDRLLEEAATSLESITERIPKARHHRKKADHELRFEAASCLVNTFREKLGQPYHSHVAVIVTLLTGITTDRDYVKKINSRNRRPVTRRG